MRKYCRKACLNNLNDSHRIISLIKTNKKEL